jgi:hypothetical protein
MKQKFYCRFLFVLLFPTNRVLSLGWQTAGKLLEHKTLTLWNSFLDKAGSCSASCEIHHRLWNLKVHCHVHKALPMVPALSQMDLFHTFLLYFFKIHFNIILPLMPVVSQWPFWHYCVSILQVYLDLKFMLPYFLLENNWLCEITDTHEHTWLYDFDVCSGLLCR